MAPHSPHSSVVLFRAPRRPWALLVAVALLVLVMLPISIVLVAVGAGADGTLPLVLALGAAVLVLLIGAALVVSARQSFTVTTTGVEVASYLSTRRIPWRDVRVVRVGPAAVLSPRATELVLRDGTAVRPLATSMSFALWRGETPLAHGADGTTPTRCTLAAIDAHRRHLAGEFDRL